MGLVVWIAICLLNMVFLCCYVDDCYSVGLVDDMTWYDPYEQFYPTDQVRLLRLWDWLGIPHKAKKQVWGEVLVIIGFLVDPNAMTATLPDDSKSDLIRHVHQFAHVARRRQTLHDFEQLTGWINWSLNVYPLLKPALSNIYAKMSGKERSHAPIYLNKAIVQDLAWFESMLRLVWHANMVIFCDASLTGHGFLGTGDGPRFHIFFWEALCVLGALVWYEQCPARLTIFTDNTNTVNIFDTLRALPDYNPILKAAVDISYSVKY
ncbi:hypothetical protein BDZ89DRAFT_1106147 [Hymenopellis radicata]|nr:hypothetical protein BDZ89DRAFT_1106147 [Hymenopellis radicata]